MKISKYANYLDEIRGFADGAGIPFPHLFLVNIDYEVDLILKANLSLDSSCTDLMYVSSGISFNAHNEDAMMLVKQNAFLVNYKTPEADFTAYNYPGYLAGNAFGFTSTGITITTNALFPVDVTTSGIPRAFINRDLLTSVTLEDAIEKATPLYCASGFSANIGSILANEIVNIEVSPYIYRVRNIQGNYSHTNMYQGLKNDLQQYFDNSSYWRDIRIDEFPVWNSIEEAREILGDNKNKQWPIYRDGLPPDTGVVTIATGVFDYNNKTLSIYLSNPKLTPVPYTVVDIFGTNNNNNNQNNN